MNNKIEAQIERIQTRIEMVRTESRVLSHKIERMEQQRKELQDEKRRLKDLMSDIYADRIGGEKWATSTIAILLSHSWLKPERPPKQKK